MLQDAALRGLEINKALVLSTAHITADENERLESFINDCDLVGADPHARDMLGGCLDVMAVPYGYWIHPVGFFAPDSAVKPWESKLLITNYPNVLGIIRFMFNHGLTYLVLDRDGNKSDKFPIFDW